jgi:hypothetical protein
MLAYSRKVQATMFEGIALVLLGSLDWWAGRWSMAQARRQAIGEWMSASPEKSIAKVWASTFIGGMYNDLGMQAEARSFLEGFTTIARTANESQTTIPYLRELARAAESEEETAGILREILILVDAAPYPRYEALPALTLASQWLAQSSAGDASALSRLELAHQRTQSWQSQASLYELKGYAAGVRGEWGESVLAYEHAAEIWEALERPFDLLRVWSGLYDALLQTGDRANAHDVQRQAIFLIEQLTAQLSESEQREAFLTLPLVQRVRGS